MTVMRVFVSVPCDTVDALDLQTADQRIPTPYTISQLVVWKCLVRTAWFELRRAQHVSTSRSQCRYSRLYMPRRRRLAPPGSVAESASSPGCPRGVSPDALAVPNALSDID
jgi:hypothetical protein